MEEIETKLIINTINWKHADLSSRPPLPKLPSKRTQTNTPIQKINPRRTIIVLRKYKQFRTTLNAYIYSRYRNTRNKSLNDPKKNVP